MSKKININLHLDNKLNASEILDNKKEILTKLNRNEFNDYKNITNNKFSVYETKLKELENLVNIDEEIIRKIKELLAELEKEKISDRLNLLENIKIGDGDKQQLLLKQLKWLVFDYQLKVNFATDGKEVVSLKDDFVNNLLKYDEITNEDGNNPTLKIEKTQNLKIRSFKDNINWQNVPFDFFGRRDEKIEFEENLLIGEEYRIWISWTDKKGIVRPYNFIWQGNSDIIGDFKPEKWWIFYVIENNGIVKRTNFFTPRATKEELGYGRIIKIERKLNNVFD